MHQDIALISTVGVSLAFAFIGGFVAARIGLPPLIGYLLAGVAVGPFTPGFVADVTLAPQLAEIGVILLMFGVGLHVSIPDLLAVKRIAIPGALVQMAVATALGCGLAMAWGWPVSAGLVFGLALSVASTVVLLRALEAQGSVNSEVGRIAVGWLVVEDLLMVIALVVLPALAGPDADTPGQPGSLWATLGLTLAKVGVFVALMLVVGKRFFPWLLTHVERTGSRELFTLGVVALALGVALGSSALFGVSFALGAFFAGVVIKESDHSHRAVTKTQPLQDTFGALFFVSVGMLFDPMVLLQQPVKVLWVVAVIVVGKALIAACIALLLGYPPATARMLSACLAQIGEFSFILAGIGIALGVLPAEAGNLILAGAMLSITINPLIFRAIQGVKPARVALTARNEPSDK